MTKIVFITSGKIDYLFKGMDLYESVDLTASGKQFPRLSTEGTDEVTEKAEELRDLGPSIIYSAPSGQCMDTAEIFAKKLNVNIVEDSRLLPLKFNIKTIFTKEEFDALQDEQFTVLRKRFIENFFEDKLIDQNSEIEKRYKSLLMDEILAKYKDQTVILVSHAYLIKLFSIYHDIKGEIYTNKNLLIKLFNPNIETMKRLECISFEI